MDAHLLIYTVFLITCVDGIINVEPYCKIEDSIICRDKCKIADKCGQRRLTFKSLTDVERGEVIARLNRWRNDVGTTGRTDMYPKGYNLRALSYDKELEFIAECVICQCLDEISPSQVDSIGVYLGQFVITHNNTYMRCLDRQFIRDTTNDISANLAYFKTVLGEENIKKKTPFTNFTFPEDKEKRELFEKRCRPWFMAIHGRTTHVGCAMLDWLDGTLFKQQLLCFTRPTGCKVNYATYETTFGGRCMGGRNSQYKSLCGKIRPLSEDTFEKPFHFDSAETSQKLISVYLVMYFMLILILY